MTLLTSIQGKVKLYFTSANISFSHSISFIRSQARTVINQELLMGSISRVWYGFVHLRGS